MPARGQQEDFWTFQEAKCKDMDILDEITPSVEKRNLQIVWRNVILFTFLHIAGVYGAYLFCFNVMWPTRLFAIVLYLCSGLGITAGAHRLWTHKSYKARLPLRVLLTVFNTIAFQGCILDWARDHRMHHKYSETDADPQNSTRGFFFSHIGWLLVRKHPEIKAKGHTIDMSDLLTDPVLCFQKKYYTILTLIACFVLPSCVPTLWGETLRDAFYVCAVFRFVYVSNVTWLVNSAAHMFGNKPYDSKINPVEIKPVSLFLFGEGFHNYHHTFPWDYKAAELGNYSLNVTKFFIDLMAIIGWAYDLKTVSQKLVQKQVKSTGDGSHPIWGLKSEICNK